MWKDYIKLILNKIDNCLQIFTDWWHYHMYGVKHKSLSEYLNSEAFFCVFFALITYAILAPDNALSTARWIVFFTLLFDILYFVTLHKLFQSPKVHRTVTFIFFIIVSIFYRELFKYTLLFFYSAYKIHNIPAAGFFFASLIYSGQFARTIQDCVFALVLIVTVVYFSYRAYRKVVHTEYAFSANKDEDSNVEALREHIRVFFSTALKFCLHRLSFITYFYLLALVFMQPIKLPVAPLLYPFYCMGVLFYAIHVDFLIGWLLWTALIIFVYCVLFGFSGYREILSSMVEWAKLREEYDLLKFVTTLVLIHVTPAFWFVSGNASILAAIGDSIYYNTEYAVFTAWTLLLIAILNAFISSFHRNPEQLSRACVYLSVAIMMLFSAFAVEYNANIAAGAKMPLFTRINAHPWLNLQYNETLVFGYDYLALLLCILTAGVFMFVFMSVVFAEINRKKLFLFLLISLEMFVLGAFLNLNLFGFFLFFEASVLPTALLIGIWGSSPRRWYAAKQFIIYSYGSSVPLFIWLAHLFNVFGTLDYLFIFNNIFYLSYNEQVVTWLVFFLVFAVKIPVYPFHSWLLNAHVEAPTGGSIILAAILLKFGLFGIIRYLLGLLGNISVEFSYYVVGLCLFSALYASLCSITEMDIKRLVAYTSIAHMSLAAAGLFLFDPRGFHGAIISMIAHGVISCALFFLIGILYVRFNTRNVIYFGGLVQLMPIFASFLFFFAVANAGFPCSIGFTGELLTTVAIFRKVGYPAVFLFSVSILLLLFSNLRLFMFICFGTVNENYIPVFITDLSHIELFCLLMLVFNAFIPFMYFDHFFSALYDDALARYYYN